MAEGLKIIVGADTDDAIAGLKNLASETETSFRQIAISGGDLQEAFSQLQKQGAVSIGSLGATIKQLKALLNTTTDVAQIDNLNKALIFLNNKEKDLLSTHVDKHFDNVTTSTGRASSSILNISRSFEVIPPEVAHVAHSFEQLFTVYERLREESGSSGEALKSFGSLLAGPVGLGLAVSIGISLLSSFIGKLFETSSGFSKAEISAAQFSAEIKKATEQLERFVSGLNFGAEIDKLQARLKLGQGFQFDIESINIDKAVNDKIISGANGIIAELDKQSDRIRSNIHAFGSTQAKELIDSFDAVDIPDSFIKKLSDSEQAGINQLKGNAELIVKTEKDRDKAIDTNQKLSLQAQIDNSNKLKRVHDKSVSDFEKFEAKTINAAKRLAAFLTKTTPFKLNFDVD